MASRLLAGESGRTFISWATGSREPSIVKLANASFTMLGPLEPYARRLRTPHVASHVAEVRPFGAMPSPLPHPTHPRGLGSCALPRGGGSPLRGDAQPSPPPNPPERAGQLRLRHAAEFRPFGAMLCALALREPAAAALCDAAEFRPFGATLCALALREPAAAALCDAAQSLEAR